MLHALNVKALRSVARAVDIRNVSIPRRSYLLNRVEARLSHPFWEKFARVEIECQHRASR